MMNNNRDWVFPAGSRSARGWDVAIETSPSWHHTELFVGTISSASPLILTKTDREYLVVPLRGSFTVEWNRRGVSYSQELQGRPDVWHGPTDTQFIGVGANVSIHGAGTVAIASAPNALETPDSYSTSQDVPVEMRGSGVCSREVRNFGTPGVLHASRLIVCEVLTPGGNWSSYPPHKHDEAIAGIETELEEIYYFENRVEQRFSHLAESAVPFGYHATSASSAGAIEVLTEVRSGDVALVPHGWHGPCIAAPGYDMYYLNVMSGPGEHEWLISNHPCHNWIRQAWEVESLDARLPFHTEGER